MGIVHPGIPRDLAVFLRDAVGVSTFVETGTYLGETAAWASSEFERVTTIEASEALAHDARARWSHLTNVDFLTGESTDLLSRLVPLLTGPTLFWLDAHWSVGNTYGEHHECPLLEEIGTLHNSNNLNILLIDDARLFLAPPPPPHRIAAWPNIADVISALQNVIPSAYIVIIEDVIIAVPNALKPIVSNHVQGISARIDEARQKPANRRSLVANLVGRIKRSLL